MAEKWRKFFLFCQFISFNRIKSLPLRAQFHLGEMARLLMHDEIRHKQRYEKAEEGRAAAGGAFPLKTHFAEDQRRKQKLGKVFLLLFPFLSLRGEVLQKNCRT